MKTIIRNSYTPKVGDYCNALVIDKETEKQYFFDADGVWTLLTGSAGDYYTKEQVDEHIGAEAEAREAEDERIWDKIEDIEMSSDVVDVVGTMADLSNYDTSTLSDNDLIKVLQDNTHGDAISYYRWDTANNQFSYVGSEGPYYTQTQTDALLDEKADYTIFYVPASATGPTRRIYKNADMTGEATVQDLINANNAGPVVLRLSTAQYPEDYSDSYLQNAFIAVNNSDYEFVFLDDRSTHNYSADETTDSVFDYYKVDLQAKLTAGTNITINGTTISATDTDTTYSAGTGLNLNGTTFSVDNTIATKTEIPTNTSDLNNDSGFITKDVSDLTNYYKKTETYTQGEVNGLISAITVPTKTSDLQNDSGFLTAATLPIASANTLGAVKIGSGISVAADGTISAAGGGSSTNYRYDLSWALVTPTATQAQIDEVEDAIANGDIIYISIDNDEVIADSTWYSNNNIDIHFTRGWASGNPATYVLEILHINFEKAHNTITVEYETPYVATKTSQITNDGSDGTSTYVEADELATVATSGSYTDLVDTPTIPTVNNATLTIQENGSQVATFTANASSNVTANIAVPVNTSDLNNDSGFITNTDYADASTGGVIKVGSGLSIDANGVLSATGGSGPTYTAGTGIDITSDVISVDNTTVPYFSDLATVATTGDYGDLLNTPTIPAAQVNSDWNANSGVAQILNKPIIPAAQIQSDWTQADSTKLDYIKNKPTIPIVNDAALTITQNGVTAGTFTANSNVGTTVALTDTTYSNFVGATSSVAGSAGLVPAPTTSDPDKFLKGDGTWATVSGGASRYDATWVTTQQTATQTQYDELRAAILAGDIIYIRDNNEEMIATHYGAPTGSVFAYFSFDELYEDQGNVSTTVAAFAVNVDGTTKAITVVADTVTIPESVPTKTSDLTNDGDDGIHPFVATDDLATVATSGSYTDLLNTPTIPAAQVNSDWDAISGVAQILNKPSLATVATSGSYNDLSNKPTIPTVNDATLTITQNGTSAGTFTANASSNTTIALTDTTYSAFTGATSSVAGAAGLVPAPTTSDPDKFLKGDGTWATPAGGTFDVTISTTTGASWTSDKTYAQIVAAISAGTPFNVRVDFPSMFTAAVNSVHYSPSDGEVYFGMSFDSGSGIITETITIDSSNNITATQDTMPTVNDGTLTIQHNGTSKGTFTANQSSNSTINIETIYADTVAPTATVGAITTANLADDAVTTAKIDDGAVTSAKIDWTTMPRLVAKAVSGAVSWSNNTFINLGFNGVKNIYDANYASVSGEDILLQPGKYMIIARIRFTDVGSGTNVFCGVRLEGESSDDNIEKGNWLYTSQRITGEATRIVQLSTATKFRLQAWTQNGGGCSDAVAWAIRLPS